jgi:flavin-dependent dehydrogenase
LMPNGLESLQALGVKLDPGCGGVFRGIRFISDSDTVDARFPTGTGFALRRVALHKQLARAAEDAGIETRWGVKRVSVVDGECRVGDERIQPDYIIGADGQNSTVRRTANLESCWYDSCRYGFRQHFNVTPWSEFVEVYWGRAKQVYVAPVGPAEVGVAVLTNDPADRVQKAIDAVPALRERLTPAKAFTRERGSMTRNRRLRRVTTNRIALIGDAAGSVDAVTGEGLSLAFLQAQLLAQSLSGGSLVLYERQHSQLFRRARLMSRLLGILSRRDDVRKRALHAAATQQEIFASLLGFHVGQQSLLAVRPAQLVEFGRIFLKSCAAR